ncbi:ABC transporter ATP-binding protein/permease [Kocuria palustris]|uniref:Lipid A export ATP-binding/permease protein MsbA n=1 Tax=Kocuria palustris PEL TaxID=1236550 RepID=M2WB75_9MICC|nr:MULTISPECIES: ABC transporter ATP-binding protein [Kocuria]ALB02624.1 multidrug ABC transporter ATPase [Kocuria palustris]EME35732.1 Lipid A export ATP-binding/permease protein MsbA [Kocuria palustris PEL]MBM7823523.1 ATP-binding cassette subfamily B protein [Kocuria palustris]MCT1833962.1 ABC transporter ATP-binding protein/permease [Kocuria palustris]MDH5151249.1 ABC transporter ATP-binding protein [Kocuria palustris]
MLLRLIRDYAGRYPGWILGTVVLQLAATMTILLLPALNARIIDGGVAQGRTGVIVSTGLVMLGVTLLQAVTAVAAVYCGARVAMGTGRDLRHAVQRRVARFSGREMDRFGTPSLITRGTNDVQQIQMLTLMGLTMMITAPLMSIGGLAMALRTDPGLSWLVWVAIPLLVVLLLLIMRRLMPLFRSMQGRIDDINGVLREQVVGMRVVRAFVREDHERQRFAGVNDELSGISLRIGQLFVLMFPLIMMILHLATAAVLWFGGHRVDEGLLEVGQMTAFTQYLLQILMALMMGVFMMMMVPRAMVSAERIGEVLRTETSLHEPLQPQAPQRLEGVVEFRDVSYSYPGAEAPVLEGISFTARPGTTTAIIGSTGAGKTTLLHLIPRLDDPTHGQVLLDGAETSRLARSEIVRRVALVPQKPYLFSGTIASNLRFGRPEATDEQLWEALETAQAADFVRRMPEQLETNVSQGGTTVSGGQRQRLSIARALIADPVVHLFDDSFSALDVTTDAALRAALRPVTRDVTQIVVAQRVATVLDADQILVLDDGRITARGTHAELLESSATYREIVDSQLSPEDPSADTEAEAAR